MADDFPDLHHRLCKQVATLTTAIYHLNTKNDENDMLLKTYVQTYEQEMDNIVQSANQVIEKHIKENAQAFELHKIQAAYKSFTAQIEEAKALSIQEYNVFQDNMREEERNIKIETEKQIDLYRMEVEGLKERIWQMQSLVEKVSGSEIKFDQEEQKTKELENQRVKKELEEKNRENTELKKRCSELERMYRELDENRMTSGRNWGKNSLDSGSGPEEWETEMLRGKLAEQDKLIMALRKAIGQENGISEGDYVASIEFDSTREMNYLGIQISNLQKEVLESGRVLKQRDEEIGKLKDQLRENYSDDRFQQKIEEYESRLKEASREHRKMIEKLHNEYSENMAEMENNFERENIRWQAILQGMQTTLDTRNDYIYGLEERLKTLELAEGKREQENQVSERYKVQEKAMNQEIERLQKLLEEEYRSFEQKLQNERNKAVEEKLRAIEQIKLENEKSLQLLTEDLNNKKNAAEAQKDAKIKELELEVEKLKQYPIQQEQLENKAREIAEEYQNVPDPYRF